MPFEALLAVTAQESVANRCVVIGEDLGTVPEGFRDQIADWGIWSYLVMMFERDDGGSFRHIDHYLTNALVTFNTHDLSTYAGWRSFGDLKLKRSLGIDPGARPTTRAGMRWRCWTTCGAPHHRPQRSLFGGEFSGAHPVAAARDLAGGPARGGGPAQHSRHHRRASELAAAASVPIEEMTSTIDVAALKAATHERSRAAICQAVKHLAAVQTMG